jgi:acetyl esterase
VDPEIVEFLRGINAKPETDLQAMPLAAALQLMRGNSLTTMPAVEADLEIRPVSIPGPAGAVPLRLYLPDSPQPHPVIINIHGGGFVSGSLNMDDHRCTTLARRLGAAIVSVDYRLAPEHPYPAALDDCYATLEWAASGRGGPMLDASRIARRVPPCCHGIDPDPGSRPRYSSIRCATMTWIAIRTLATAAAIF